MTDRDERALSLMDDAATISAITRRIATERLRSIAFADWSWLDLIGHVADTAELFAGRLRRIVEEDEPMITEEHLRIIRLLDLPGAPTRTGHHSSHGRVDGGWIADYQMRHSREHTLELAGAFPPV